MNKLHVILMIALVVAVGILLTPISDLYVLVLVVGVLVFFGAMSLWMGAQFFLNSIPRTSAGNVLLSFDDGPDPVNTPLVLDILKKHNVTALFFLIGKKVKGNEALISRIHEEGHLLGSHSFSHAPTMGFWNRERTTTDIAEGHAELLKIIPQAGNLYRPPFGVTNPAIAYAIKKCGLRSVGWTVRSFDTIRKEPAKMLNSLKRSVKGSDIVLMHDTQPHTLSILDPLIVELKKRKLTLKAELN
ncbi:polysaccharide deacetylase family protein [Algoriphagus sp. AGSA1]|uniref:polysaccharide deacetylase family protein n=1 Tax=Algoriphagus sp. AGSA1 TaxID=2907213 RepID=UPI001F2F6FB0|nr:polysaccharide deacetylase family protein [Algoriphagus sp. AGSA1]MCE7056460.1 polysaccharide deacetylase family protein [Algoriphagus sp. AGSA1]